MPISNPDPIQSRIERRLLVLLGRLLESQQPDGSVNRNTSPNEIPLTDSEIKELIQLLQSYEDSPTWLAKSTFLDGIFSGLKVPDAALREIYLRERSRRGRTSRVMSGRLWQEFKTRLGIEAFNAGFKPVKKMTYDIFMKMERILFSARGLSRHLADKLCKLVGSFRDHIDNWRAHRSLRQGHGQLTLNFRALLTGFVESLERLNARSIRELSATRVSAILVIICNASALFTTRDWDVGGVISAIAGAVPLAIAG